MDAAARREMTLEEFLAWDEGQEGRWEFDGFAPVAMVGGTWAHSLITTNLIRTLGNLLRGTGCFVHNDTLKVLAAGSVRYPDGFVQCRRSGREATIAVEPVVVFEVLSPSTGGIDQITKNAEYRATPSILRYVMLAQDRIAANFYERRGELWVGTLVTDADAVLEMPEIGVSLPLAPLYEEVFEGLGE